MKKCILKENVIQYWLQLWADRYNEDVFIDGKRQYIFFEYKMNAFRKNGKIH